MEGEPSFLPLLLIAALAALIPFLSYRLTGGIVPAVVGEVVIGIIFGEPLLGLLGHSEWLDFLALFGFAYLMFLSGLEINLNVLTTSPGPRWYLPHVALRHPLISGLLFMGLTIGATYLALRVLWEIDFIDLSHKPMLLFIFIATSVGVLVPVLKDRPDLGAMAQAVLVGGFLVEFVAIVGVGVVAALDRTGVGWEMGLLAAMPVALALLVWAAKSGGGRFPIIGRTLHELADTSAQLKIRAALVVLIAFVALSELVGTELVLGAFLAGLAATVISPQHGSAVRVRLDALGYGFFVPIFFIHAGATLDFGVVFQSFDAFIVAPIFLLMAFLIKLVPALLTLAPAHGLRNGLSGGALLSANLSLVIAAGAIAEELGIIDEALFGAMILMALLSTVLAPLFFNLLAGRAPSQSEGLVMLIGGGEVTNTLAARLATAGRVVSVIMPHDEEPPEWRELSILRIPGDPLDEWPQRVAGLHQAEVAVLTSWTTMGQLEMIAERLRERRHDLRIVTWLNEPSEKLAHLGVEMHLSSDATARALESAVMRPGLYQAMANPESGVVEVQMRNSTIHGRTLKELSFAGGVRVLIVIRGGEAFVADAGTLLLTGDSVTLGGDPGSVAEVARMLMDPGERQPLLPPVVGESSGNQTR